MASTATASEYQQIRRKRFGFLVISGSVMVLQSYVTTAESAAEFSYAVELGYAGWHGFAMCFVGTGFLSFSCFGHAFEVRLK